MKILLLHYYPGSGCKFITNCLSYSHKVAFQNFEIAKNILKDKELLEQSLLATIPPKEKSREWLNYEQGCFQLFGKELNNKRSTSLNDLNLNDLNDLNDLNQLGDVWLPLMAHRKDNFIDWLQKVKDNNIFKVLINADPAFIDFAIRLKWPGDHHCLDLDDYLKWNNEIELSNYDFVINNWNPLIHNNHSNIVELGKQIGIEFDLALAKNYIEKYINFHNV